MIPPTRSKPVLESFAALDTPQLISRFAVGVECFDPRLFKLPDWQLDTAFGPEHEVGRWPCRVLVGHLADAEVAFVHRLRRVAGEENPVFSAWDEDSFIERGLYGHKSSGVNFPLAGFIATIHTLRKWTSQWLSTLPERDWSRRGLHPVRGEQTLRVVLNYDTWHLEHHAWYLNRKIAKLIENPPPIPG